MENHNHERPKLTLDQLELNGHSLTFWHSWLITDRESGESNAHLLTPTSRYGLCADQCSWAALALECVVQDANGPADDIEASLEFDMSLVVNNHQDVEDLLLENWENVPEALREMLHHDPTNGLTREQRIALARLSERYGVDFDPMDFSTAYDLPDKWVNGWVGGFEQQKLYVGVSPEGEVHS